MSSQLSYLPHPEDPSLISIYSKVSSKFSNGDVHTKLSSKVEKLSQKNAKLQEKLSKKEHEINELQEKNESLNQALSSLAMECSTISSQKINDLSKTNRNLNSQLLSMKTRYRDLESKNQELQEILENKDKLLEKLEETKIKEPPKQSEIQLLNDNLEKTKRKMFEATNLNLQLKNELKMAHKCLQKEIGGESINIQQILNSASNWRGRAQQIQMLQSKLAEMRDKLDSQDCDSFDITDLPLKRLESVRRLEIDSLTKELEECKNELQDLNQKVSALKIRNKNLSDEATNYKIKTFDLMEKSKNDDDYIKCLNEKVSMIKYECEHKLNEMEKEMNKTVHSCDDSKLEVQKLQRDFDNALQSLSNKDSEILNLKGQIEDLENNLRGISSDFLFSCRGMNKTDYIDLIKALEQEKNHLLKMIEELNKRLNKQSILESEQHDVIAKQRVKISRLDAKIRDLESEKEAVRQKHRRGIRINEYSRALSGNNINCRPVTRSNEKFTSELDRLKLNESISRLEYATERIEYLEKKLKMQSDDRDQDCQQFIDIIAKSKEYFRKIFQQCKDSIDENPIFIDEKTENEYDETTQ